MIRNFLSATPFILCSLLAPDNGGSAGGGGPAPDSNVALPTAMPEPEANATIEQQLAHWKKTASDFFSRLGSEFKGKNDEISAHGATKTALQTEQAAHTTTKGELSTLNSQLSTVRNELSSAKTTITGLTTERDNANKNVTHLEKLCGNAGIDYKNAVPPAAEGEHLNVQSDSIEGLQKQFAQEKDSGKRAEIAAKIRKLEVKKQTADG